MSKIQIFVEGKEDKKLTKDYLFHLKVNTSNVIIDVANGWTNLHLIKNKLIENTNKGGINLLIFDADADCQTRRQSILQKGTELQISFELFLLPNDQNPGAIEDLLIAISNPVHQGIFTCFDDFKQCLTQSSGHYSLPDNKAKVFAYLEALSSETNSDKRDFLDENLWDLTHTILNPLQTFLLQHCQQNNPQ